ncbi:hypothetical protein [Sutcliffiella rhizosphaerae]|uniref:Uncharacterized protein n=1 Tax=Sutcliffiella rhizosphaerae TaxID=2880967 RepID=A0ABM8YJL4_9BACI|nr:hypothetical protein [Sutcliffiella rhizosphaerae]CAG9620118.1 hypothetical protein BACCIP111883_00886 [Sutcliffiella rhizosphaerae]
MKSFTCNIDSFRIGEMQSAFNHISIPIAFEILVGGRWMKGKVFYHHYHRTISYDSNLSELIQLCTNEKKEELRQAVVQYVEEKTNRGLTIARPHMEDGARAEA